MAHDGFAVCALESRQIISEHREALASVTRTIRFKSPYNGMEVSGEKIG